MKHFHLKSRASMRASIWHMRTRDGPKKTGARARRASKAGSKSGFGELIWARGELMWAYLRARACPESTRMGACVVPRAHVHCSRALLAHLACAPVFARVFARARVKCSRSRAAHPAAGEAPYNIWTNMFWIKPMYMLQACSPTPPSWSWSHSWSWSPPPLWQWGGSLVCMYVRTYVRTYVCMSVCMYVCLYVCMSVCLY